MPSDIYVGLDEQLNYIDRYFSISELNEKDVI
jgi:hypothetical protein